MTLQHDSTDSYMPDAQDLNTGSLGDRTEGTRRNLSGISAQVSPLQSHLDKAEALLTQGRYNEAVRHYKYAAERFKIYRERIDGSMRDAIGQMSTLGCRATPPHPKAIDLVRIKSHLAQN